MAIGPVILARTLPLAAGLILSVWDSSPEAEAAGTCWSDNSDAEEVVTPVACSEASTTQRAAAIRTSQAGSGGAAMAASMLRLLSRKPYLS